MASDESTAVAATDAATAKEERRQRQLDRTEIVLAIRWGIEGGGVGVPRS